MTRGRDRVRRPLRPARPSPRRSGGAGALPQVVHIKSCPFPTPPPLGFLQEPTVLPSCLHVSPAVPGSHRLELSRVQLVATPWTAAHQDPLSKFASLGRFIPRYFVIFTPIVNGIIVFISHADLLLLLYRNARHTCAIILYPATLLK